MSAMISETFCLNAYELWEIDVKFNNFIPNSLLTLLLLWSEITSLKQSIDGMQASYRSGLFCSGLYLVVRGRTSSKAHLRNWPGDLSMAACWEWMQLRRTSLSVTSCSYERMFDIRIQVRRRTADAHIGQGWQVSDGHAFHLKVYTVCPLPILTLLQECCPRRTTKFVLYIQNIHIA